MRIGLPRPVRDRARPSFKSPSTWPTGMSPSRTSTQSPTQRAAARWSSVWPCRAWPTTGSGLRGSAVLPGLAFREAMSGRYWRLDAPENERAIAMTIEALRARSIGLRPRPHLRGQRHDRRRRHRLQAPPRGHRCAEVRAGGAASTTGSRSAATTDDATSSAGRRSGAALPRSTSLTVLDATLYGESGEEFARATLRFDERARLGDVAQELPAEVRSLAVTHVL